ncbi:hypothetical protein EG859_15395, partial [Enterococcus faecalis]
PGGPAAGARAGRTAATGAAAARWPPGRRRAGPATGWRQSRRPGRTRRPPRPARAAARGSGSRAGWASPTRRTGTGRPGCGSSAGRTAPPRWPGPRGRRP